MRELYTQHYSFRLFTAIFTWINEESIYKLSGLSGKCQDRQKSKVDACCCNLKKTMTEAKSTRTVRRGRIFPEIQWTEEQIAQWEAEQEAFYQRCKPIFDRLKPELLGTHYNWYMAVEPESGDYFIDKDEIVAINMSRQKHPTAIFFLFRINEKGVSGTI